MLLSIGVYGVLARRNLLVMLMSLELMLVAVNIVLMLFSRMEASQATGSVESIALMLRHAHTGQVFTLMVMTVAAGEVGVGLAILITLYRARGSIDMRDATELKL